MDLSFYWDNDGVENDVVLETPEGDALIEFKSGQTIQREFFKSLDRETKSKLRVASKTVIYPGTERKARSSTGVVPY